MFESSLIESKSRVASPEQRWTAAVSLTLQCALVALAIVLPLFHPIALQFRTDAPKVFMPAKILPKPEPPVRVERSQTASPSGASAPNMGHALTPSLHPQNLPATGDEPPETFIGNIGSGSDASDPLGAATSGVETNTRVTLAKPPKPGALHISSGVSQGLLLTPIRPVYPPIARSARLGGTVIVEALISKTGRIESAHATSGPEMLRQAAVDAIQQARYSPYLLNGFPTEVQTTITVTFRLEN
jgi:protein TonB